MPIYDVIDELYERDIVFQRGNGVELPFSGCSSYRDNVSY